MATYPLSESYADGNVLSAANVNSITEGVNDVVFPLFNAQTGTSYTLVLADAMKLVTLTNGSAITLTVPPNTGGGAVAFPVGTQILLYQGGAGQVSVTSTDTIRSQGSKLKMNGQYSVCGLLKVAATEWVFFGNTAA